MEFGSSLLCPLAANSESFKTANDRFKLRLGSQDKYTESKYKIVTVTDWHWFVVYYPDIPNHNFCQKFNFMKTFILVNLTLIQFDGRFLIWKVQKISNFHPKFAHFPMFCKFNFWPKSRFLARKINYLLLFEIKYSRISCNCRAKIQTPD